MACLEALPHELINDITTWIAFKDIQSLTLTSKSLRAATMLAFFRDVSMRWKWNCCPHAEPNPAMLLRSLLERPQNAVYVRNLEFLYRGFGFLGIDWSPEQELPAYWPTLGPEERETFEQAIDAAGFVAPESWKKAVIEERSVKAVIGLLLLICPNLERFSLDVDFLLSNHWISEVLCHGAHMTGKINRRPLQRLRRISVGCEPGTEEAYASVKLPGPTYRLMFQLPLVEHADFVLLPRVTSGDDWTAGEIIATRLTRLHLSHALLYPANLKPFLKDTPNITTLECHFLRPRKAKINLTKLRSVLEQVSGSLQHLSLGCATLSDNIYSPQPLEIWRGSLSSLFFLASLTTLRISLAMLIGEELPETKRPLTAILPNRLEMLTIVYDLDKYEIYYCWTELAFLEMLRVYLTGETIMENHMNYTVDPEEITWRHWLEPGWRHATPQLRQLCVQFTEPARHSDAWDNQETGLKGACERQGLQCVFFGNEETTPDDAPQYHRLN